MIRRKNITAVLLAIIIFLSTLGFPTLSVYASSGDSGTVTSCKYDYIRSTVTVSGTVNHKVLTSSSDAKVAIFRVMPWENAEDVILESQPLSEQPVSIKFDFSVPCPEVIDRLCMYAVALIMPDGERKLMTSPRYPDCTSVSASSLDFKGISTVNVADAVEYGAGSIVIDVYLDKLESGKQSGYLYSIDDYIFYFDRAYIDSLDVLVRSCYAAGTDVILRFLVSSPSVEPVVTDIEPEVPDDTDDPAGEETETDVTPALPKYSAISVENIKETVRLFAYTDYLVSRYSGSSNGKISGIIIGRGADDPGIYNNSYAFGSFYFDLYARAAAVIGIASGKNLSGGKIALIIPVTDRIACGEYENSYDFLDYVCDYLSSRTTLTYTVMLESTSNPYGLYDEYFFDPEDIGGGDEGEETDPDETETNVPPETSVPVTDTENYTSDTISDIGPTETYEPETETEAGDSPETPPELQTESSEPVTDTMPVPPDSTDPDVPFTREPPEKNEKGSGICCSDTSEMFLSALEKLRKQYSCIGKGYIWCWYPDVNTNSAALNVCFVYNYLKTATDGASAFILALEDSTSGSFEDISHVFRYINTAENEKETGFALSVFGESRWDDVISGYNSEKIVTKVLNERELHFDYPGITGVKDRWDFTSSNGDQGWKSGLGCLSLKSTAVDDGRVLRARMDGEQSTGEYSDICFICDPAEPLLFCDSLSFRLSLGEKTGELFEVKIKIYGSNFVIDSECVVPSGVPYNVFLDTTDFTDTTNIISVRMCTRRITGKGEYDLDVYRISYNSKKYDSSTLSSLIESARADIAVVAGKNEGKSSLRLKLIAGGILLGAASFTVAIAMAADPKRKKKE